jgi:hypothetical protein
LFCQPRRKSQLGSEEYVRSLIGLVSGSHELNLHTIDAVHAVNEKNEDEYKGDLHPILDFCHNGILRDETVQRSIARPPRSEHPETYVKILRLTLKGSGMIKSMNSVISRTRRTKTFSFNQQAVDWQAQAGNIRGCSRESS